MVQFSFSQSRSLFVFGDGTFRQLPVKESLPVAVLWLELTYLTTNALGWTSWFITGTHEYLIRSPIHIFLLSKNISTVDLFWEMHKQRKSLRGFKNATSPWDIICLRHVTTLLKQRPRWWNGPSPVIVSCKQWTPQTN